MGISKEQVAEFNETNLPTDPIIKIRSSKHREVNNALLTYSQNCFKVEIAADGNSITSPYMTNRDIAAVCINDNMKNTGIEKETADSDTLTFTDGTTLIAGDIVTIWLSI